MYLLIADSGHNERVAGKKSPDNSFFEWQFNDDVQHMLETRAKELGVSVFLTNPNPNGKDEIGLSKRSELANNHWKNNKKPNAIFISLHANAYGNGFNTARGTETYVAGNASSKSKNFAKVLNNEVVKCMKSLDSNAKDRGVKTENFTVIAKADMPSVLVEYGFYTNKEDLKILKDNKKELVEATLKAVCQYFGIAYKEPVKPQPKPIVKEVVQQDDIFYRLVAGSFEDKSNALEQQEELKKQGIDTFIAAYKK